MSNLSFYFTYIVRCADGSYYCGSTNNLKQRIRQHNGELSGGAKYTRGRRPLILVYCEKHVSFKQAARRENELKKLTHKQKEKLCMQLKNSFYQ